MTQTNRQRAIEIVTSAIISNAAHTTGEEDDAKVIIDELNRNDFCSDSVRELVKKLCADIAYRQGGAMLDNKDRELLLKIVED